MCLGYTEIAKGDKTINESCRHPGTHQFAKNITFIRQTNRAYISAIPPSPAYILLSVWKDTHRDISQPRMSVQICVDGHNFMWHMWLFLLHKCCYAYALHCKCPIVCSLCETRKVLILGVVQKYHCQIICASSRNKLKIQ